MEPENFLLCNSETWPQVDNAIQWINNCPTDIAITFPHTYPLDSDLSDG